LLTAAEYAAQQEAAVAKVKPKIEPYKGTVKKVARAPNPLSVKRKQRADASNDVPDAKKRRGEKNDNDAADDDDDDDDKATTDKRPVPPLRRIAKKRGVRGGRRTHNAKAKERAAASATTTTTTTTTTSSSTNHGTETTLGEVPTKLSTKNASSANERSAR
jgi:hypothetical protein